MKRWLVPLLLTLLLVSCAPLEPLATEPVQTQTQPPPTAAPTLPPVEPTLTPTQSITPTPAPDYPDAAAHAVQAAIDYLPRWPGLEIGEIRVLQVTAIAWPNACLGVNTDRQMCAEAITPGFVIDLERVEDGRSRFYVFHTDSSGGTLIMLPGAVRPARQALLAQTGLRLEDIDWVSVGNVEWRDSCLGVVTPGINCLDVIVPGYRIVFQVGDIRYEYHTDQDGKHVVLVSVPESPSEGSILGWNSLSEPCTTVEISLDEVYSGPCEADLAWIGDIPPARAVELARFAELYAPQARETASGVVTWRGSGTVIATPVEMRMLAEWTRLVYDETVSGRSGAAWSLAFSWHREGGIAGFCDDLAVYLTGQWIATSCNAGSGQDSTWFSLDSQQLARLYTWVDSLAPFELEQTDPATADAMTIRLVFAGQGTGAVSANQQSGMLHLADELALQAQTPPDPQAQAAAQQALTDYLAALEAADYASAATLYGGSYNVLIDNNPSRDPNNHASLFEGACTINGHVCNLAVHNIVHVAGLGAGVYRFMVELENPQGALFELWQCCTDIAEDTPPQTQFRFLVQWVDGRYLVMTLPIYAG